MNAQELLNPRFEVIADYPNNRYKVGDILQIALNPWNGEPTDIFHKLGEQIYVGNFFKAEELEKYPHIFRKLEWYENRNYSELPKKIRYHGNNDDDDIEVVTEWKYANVFGVQELWFKTDSYNDWIVIHPNYLPIE